MLYLLCTENYLLDTATSVEYTLHVNQRSYGHKTDVKRHFFAHRRRGRHTDIGIN